MAIETVEICNWTSHTLNLISKSSAHMYQWGWPTSLTPTECWYPVIQFDLNNDPNQDTGTAIYQLSGTSPVQEFKFTASMFYLDNWGLYNVDTVVSPSLEVCFWSSYDSEILTRLHPM